MGSNVYFANLRARDEHSSTVQKIRRLFDAAGFDRLIARDGRTAVKLHFGEREMILLSVRFSSGRLLTGYGSAAGNRFSQIRIRCISGAGQMPWTILRLQSCTGLPMLLRAHLS
jgi:hypothetical protein